MPIHPRREKPRCWVGYCRKSTDAEDKQIHTLGDQQALIEQHYARLPEAERAGRPLKLFQEARSAYRPGRPVFDAVLGMAVRGEVHGLIVVHPNRVSRNHADSGSFVQRLVEGKVHCLDTTAGKRYTGADSNDIFMLTLEGAMSWKDSRDKGDRIRFAMRMRAAEGRHMGPVHLGYRSVYRPDGSSALEVVPETAAPLRRLFALAATGSYSVQHLTNEAARIGLRSRHGRKVGRSAVHEILRDPLYKGHIRFAGAVAKGVHEPLIDEATWERVQAHLTARNTNAGKPKDLALRELFVFGSLLSCGRCGRVLCPYRVKGRYIYYQCKNPDRRCGVLVSQPEVIEQYRTLLGRIQVSEPGLEELRQGMTRRARERSRDAGARRRTLGAAYEQLQREIGDLFAQRSAAAALGVADAVDLRLAGLRARRDELQAQLAAPEPGVDATEAVVGSFTLIKLLGEAAIAGSMPIREGVLRGVASNYPVVGKTLLPELRSPFRQRVETGGGPGWWTGLDDVRTEAIETFQRLQATYAMFRGG